MKKNGDAVALYHLHTVLTGWAKKLHTKLMAIILGSLITTLEQIY